MMCKSCDSLLVSGVTATHRVRGIYTISLSLSLPHPVVSCEYIHYSLCSSEGEAFSGKVSDLRQCEEVSSKTRPPAVV